jgi:hypothetical protein
MFVAVVLALGLVFPVNAQRSQFGGNPIFQEFMTAQRQKGQAFQDAENQEGKAFLATQAGKPKVEKIAAIRVFKTEQYEKNCAFREKSSEEWDAFMTQAFAQKGAQGGQQLAMMKQRREAQMVKTREFFAQKHAENMAFLDKALGDQALDGAELDKALGEFFQAQKASAEQFMNQLRQGSGQGQGQGQGQGKGQGRGWGSGQNRGGQSFQGPSGSR